MTKREFFERVLNLNVDEEMNEFAEAEIRKLDERAERERNSPKKLENKALTEEIRNYLAEKKDGAVAAEIAKHLDKSTSKISALLTTMVKNGEVTANGVKIGKGYKNLYKIAVEENATE